MGEARKRRPAPAGTRRERGAVLIVALVLLVVLTLLGVTAMNTTQLEERMAANAQEMQRAFQAAENGLSQAFNDSDAWDLAGANSVVTALPGAVVGGIQAGWTSTFISFSPPPPNSGFDTSFQSANFDFEATGRRQGIVGGGGGGGNDLDVVVHGGGFQIAPNPGAE